MSTVSFLIGAFLQKRIYAELLRYLHLRTIEFEGCQKNIWEKLRLSDSVLQSTDL